MLRIAIIVLSYLYMLPYWWFIKIKSYANRDKYSQKESFHFIKRICIKVIKRARVSVVVSGQENIPSKGGYLITPNHQGLFDVLTIFKTHPNPFRVVVKKELEKTILVKDLIKALDLVPLDRQNVRNATKTIGYVANEVKKGDIFIIFPEGTRSKFENKVIEFKAGSFKIAQKAQAPILPVALIDSYKVFDRNSYKRTEVQIHYLPPIPYEEYKDLKTVEIAQMVQNRIQNAINEKIGASLD